MRGLHERNREGAPGGAPGAVPGAAPGGFPGQITPGAPGATTPGATTTPRAGSTSSTKATTLRFFSAHPGGPGPVESGLLEDIHITSDARTNSLVLAAPAKSMDLLLALNRSENTTLILVTHDAMLASRAGRIVTLRDGRVVADEMRETAPAAHQHA